MKEALAAAGIVEGESYQLAAIHEKRITCETFTDPSSGFGWAAAQEGDKYICLNPVRADLGTSRAKATDVTAVRCLLLDFDPKKTDADPCGLSDTSRGEAESAARATRERLGGVLVDSGRGWQLWVRHDEDVNRESVVRAVKAFAGAGWPLVTVDSTFDPARLARLPGFTNTRTGRVARIVE